MTPVANPTNSPFLQTKSLGGFTCPNDANSCSPEKEISCKSFHVHYYKTQYRLGTNCFSSRHQKDDEWRFHDLIYFCTWFFLTIEKCFSQNCKGEYRAKIWFTPALDFCKFEAEPSSCIEFSIFMRFDQYYSRYLSWHSSLIASL